MKGWNPRTRIDSSTFASSGRDGRPASAGRGRGSSDGTGRSPREGSNRDAKKVERRGGGPKHGAERQGEGRSAVEREVEKKVPPHRPQAVDDGRGQQKASEPAPKPPKTWSDIGGSGANTLRQSVEITVTRPAAERASGGSGGDGARKEETGARHDDDSTAKGESKEGEKGTEMEVRSENEKKREKQEVDEHGAPLKKSSGPTTAPWGGGSDRVEAPSQTAVGWLRHEDEKDRVTSLGLFDYPRTFPCGIANVGNTCYFNVIVQSLAQCHSFSTSFFSLFSASPSLREGKNKLHHLHKLLAQITFGPLITVDPSECAEALGLTHTVRGVQMASREEDVGEFLLGLIHLIEAAMAEADGVIQAGEGRARSSSSEGRTLHNVFYGAADEEVRVYPDLDPETGEPTAKLIANPMFPHEYTETTADIQRSLSSNSAGSSNPYTVKARNRATFSSLYLQADAGSVEMALRQYQEEVISDYKDEDKVVYAKKVLTFVDLPSFLPITLQRIQYDVAAQSVIKSNRKFEFPFTLILQDGKLRECREEEKDQKAKQDKKDVLYNLRSIIVHRGSSAKTGHYYGFIRMGDTWWRVNDFEISPASFEIAYEEAVGGARATRSASVLFYERHDSRKVAQPVSALPEELQKYLKMSAKEAGLKLERFSGTVDTVKRDVDELVDIATKIQKNPSSVSPKDAAPLLNGDAGILLLAGYEGDGRSSYIFETLSNESMAYETVIFLEKHKKEHSKAVRDAMGCPEVEVMLKHLEKLDVANRSMVESRRPACLTSQLKNDLLLMFTASIRCIANALQFYRNNTSPEAMMKQLIRAYTGLHYFSREMTSAFKLASPLHMECVLFDFAVKTLEMRFLPQVEDNRYATQDEFFDVSDLCTLARDTAGKDDKKKVEKLFARFSEALHKSYLAWSKRDGVVAASRKLFPKEKEWLYSLNAAEELPLHFSLSELVGQVTQWYGDLDQDYRDFMSTMEMVDAYRSDGGGWKQRNKMAVSGRKW